MTDFKTLRDIPALKGRVVLLRVDMNVPFKGGVILDPSRIERIRPTLQFLREGGAKVVMISHLGRPQERVEESLSLKGVADYLEVPLSKALLEGELENELEHLREGEAILLENIRFCPGEISNDATLAQALASPSDLYVNDAFSVSHRAHMSVEAITHFLPSYAGFLMEEELTALSQTLTHPQRPVMALIGGAKVSTKLQVLENLAETVDTLVIGGAMANTFLMAQGFPVGKSLVEHDLCETARSILKSAPCRILLPTDVVCAPELGEGVPVRTHAVSEVGKADRILDLGPETVGLIEEALESARTVVVNGPLGAFEIPPFDRATLAVFRAIARLTKRGQLTSVAGGGDTVSALEGAGVLGDLTYVSTAGGAFLEWMEGKTLPGVAALES